MERGKRKISPPNRITRFFPRVNQKQSDEQQGSSAGSNESACDEEKVYQPMARFVCEASVPIEFIRSLTTILNPSFPFKYVNLGRSCIKVYHEVKATMTQTMDKLDGLISLSMDIFRYDTYDCYSLKEPEGITVYDFLCIRAHFIDDNWTPKSWVIYYGDVYHILKVGYEKTILKCLSGLHIESKISTITPADSSKYDEMVEFVKDQLKEKKRLQIKWKPFQIRCCADLFRRMVEAAFEEIKDIINKVLPSTSPYWHVTFSSLQEAIQLEAKGKFLDQYYDFMFANLPTDEDWVKLRYVCRLVEYINNAAEVLFMTKNPTACIYVYNLGELQASLRKESLNPDRLSLVTDLLEKFDEYWNDMFLVLAIATVMDPRYKMKYIEFFSLKYEDTSGNSQVKTVLEAIQGLYDDYKMHSLEAHNSASDSVSKPSDTKPSDAMPSDTMPSDAMLTDTMPSDAMLTDTMPSDAMPFDAMPSDAMLTDTMPSDAMPSDSKPSNAMPSDSKPSGAMPSDSKPSDADSEENLSDGTLDSEDDIPDDTLERLRNCNFGFNCLDEYNEFLNSSNRPPKSDLEWYLDEPVLPWTQDFDLMSWWRTESPKYPILSKMACDLLAIPLTVARSYEAYMHKDFRSADKSLASVGTKSPALVYALACTRSYYHKQQNLSQS